MQTTTWKQGNVVQPVDLRLSMVKLLGAMWIVGLYDYMKSKPNIIKNGLRQAGLAIQY